jgi:hypothetical protein
MLTADLTVVDNQATVTLPGNAGSLVYAQVTGLTTTELIRRVAATANTRPTTLTIGHALEKTGFNQRCRSKVDINYRAVDTDLSLTGGVVPSARVYIVIDRPINSGGIITDAILQRLVGSVCDVVTRSGQLGKLLNQEA